jgi:hypothetical protein
MALALLCTMGAAVLMGPPRQVREFEESKPDFSQAAE